LGFQRFPEGFPAIKRKKSAEKLEKKGSIENPREISNASSNEQKPGRKISRSRLNLGQIFFAVFQGGPADFANLYFCFTGFLFVKNLYVLPLTERADAPAVGNQFPNPFASMCF
jgi:hypothetical protein